MMKKLLLFLVFVFAISGCVGLQQQLQDEDLYQQMREGGAKITEYGELAVTGIAADDVFVVVDVSDTTMAASGTTKKYKWSSSVSDMLVAIRSGFATVWNTEPTGSDLVIGALYIADNEEAGWKVEAGTTDDVIVQCTGVSPTTFASIRMVDGSPLMSGISELIPFIDDDGVGSIRLRFNTTAERDITIPGDAAITLSYTVASGSKALATAEIASGACTAAQTDTATGTATTDVILWGFNGDITSTTGYSPTANGMLTIIVYPTADTFNAKICNNTASAITPGAVTLNWRVVR